MVRSFSSTSCCNLTTRSRSRAISAAVLSVGCSVEGRKVSKGSSFSASSVGRLDDEEAVVSVCGCAAR